MKKAPEIIDKALHEFGIQTIFETTRQGNDAIDVIFQIIRRSSS